MRIIPLLAASLLVCASVSAQEPDLTRRSNHYLDHVVLGINDLDTGIRNLELLTGVEARFDGRDPQMGTQSAVIGLGEKGYLEIIAPDPKADPADIDADLKVRVLDRLAGMESLTPFQWVIGTSNMERTAAIARRAGSRFSAVREGTRKRGWGKGYEWSWARVDLPESAVTPQFISWNEDSKLPQDRAPDGCELTYLQLNSRTFKSLHTLLAAMQIEADAKGAEKESMSFSLECSRGEVVFEASELKK